MNALDVRADAWLRRYRDPLPGAPRLLCFPHAGGSANFFLPLARELSPEIEVLAVQYPGRQDRLAEEPLRTVGDLAAGVVAALTAREAAQGPGAGPLVLFGHSMGAVVAFEVARRLGSGPAGGPAALIASACRAPSRLRRDPVHRYGDEGVLAELRRLGGTGGVLLQDPELLRMVLPTIRADYEALTSYTVAEPAPGDPARPLDCPVTVLLGEEDPVVPLDDALAWEWFTTGPCASETFPGGHFYLSARQELVAASIRAAVRPHA
ncbi:thioesterase II family protein [Streptomyces sp. BI20]|uniref:thioesterase II family protein n=1 Tax=Streptomyces sp. BI20 TaxID=3403460 RepID=UPI003C7256B7